MSTVQADGFTVDDLLAMPDEQRFELVDGRLVEREMSEESSWISGKVFRQLGNQGEDSGLGWAFPDGTGFQCFTDDPARVRRPDAAFIGRDRMPSSPSRKGYTRVSPHLAVEVVSPNDKLYDVEDKVAEWLSAGVTEVWVVRPASRTVEIHRADERTLVLAESDHLTMESVLPGFRCKVGDLFPPTEAAG